MQQNYINVGNPRNRHLAHTDENFSIFPAPRPSKFLELFFYSNEINNYAVLLFWISI